MLDAAKHCRLYEESKYLSFGPKGVAWGGVRLLLRLPLPCPHYSVCVVREAAQLAGESQAHCQISGAAPAISLAVDP